MCARFVLLAVVGVEKSRFTARYLLTIYLVYSFVDGTETQQVSPIRLNVLFEVFHAYKHVWNTCSKYVLSDLILMNDRPEAVICIPDISD